MCFDHGLLTGTVCVPWTTQPGVYTAQWKGQWNTRAVFIEIIAPWFRDRQVTQPVAIRGGRKSGRSCAASPWYLEEL